MKLTLLVNCSLALLAFAEGYVTSVQHTSLAQESTSLADTSQQSSQWFPQGFFNFFGGSEGKKQRVNKTFVMPMHSFTNLRDGKALNNHFIETQKSHEAFAAHAEVALLHFLAGGDPLPKGAAIDKVKLSLQAKSNGTLFGDVCPSRAFMLLATSSNGEHALAPPMQVGLDSDLTNIDITPLFKTGGEIVNGNDFYLKLEANPQCYLAFEGQANKPMVQIDAAFDKYQPKTMTSMAAIGPGIIVVALVIAGVIYKKRQKSTDYSYFYDNAANEPNVFA